MCKDYKAAFLKKLAGMTGNMQQNLQLNIKNFEKIQDLLKKMC
jgi:hypothetical protein